MKTPSLYSKAVRAFTLVELLVVIGIIALLISILLPVMGKVREQSQATKCMANLHVIYVGLRAYSVENKDSFPWGFMWERTPATMTSAIPSPSAFTNWASSLAKFMNIRRPSVDIAGNYATRTYNNMYTEVTRCPSVDQTFSQLVTYSVLTTAMPNYSSEVTFATGTGVIMPLGKPAKFADLYPDNTIMWDSAAWNRLKPESPNEWIQGSTIQGGIGNIAYTFIDGGQISPDSGDPGNRDLRYRDKFNDVYAGIDPYLAQGTPIYIPSKQSYSNSNTDIGTDAIQYGQCGVPRFRHNREKGCNALIADGSVRTFLIPGIDKGGGKYYNDKAVVESEWLRKYIMIKFPN